MKKYIVADRENVDMCSKCELNTCGYIVLISHLPYSPHNIICTVCLLEMGHKHMSQYISVINACG